MAMVGAERRLGDVIFVHPHLEVSTAQIQFGEEHGAVEFIQEFLNDGNWEHIPYRLRVQRPVVDTESPAVVLLAHKDG